MNPANKPLVAYYRVSTQRQGRSGLGLEAQQAAVRRFAEERGVGLIAEFQEIESGKVIERPQLEAALRVAKRTHGILCVAKLDRLARDAAFVLGLRSSGVEFVAVDMPHMNRLAIGIMALVAEYEREQISERTKAALAAARARGVKLGGWRDKTGPASIEAGRTRMMENARKRRAKLAPMICSALNLCEGNFSDAARKLNAADVPTPSGHGEWHAAQVKRYLDRGELLPPAD